MPSTMVNLLADETGLSRFEFGDRPPVHRLKRGFRQRRYEFRHDDRHITVVPTHGNETAAEINSALENSGYRLCGIHCVCSDGNLVLNGRASCYYHVQVALTTAMRLAGSRRVTCQVKVMSAK